MQVHCESPSTECRAQNARCRFSKVVDIFISSYKQMLLRNTTPDLPTSNLFITHKNLYFAVSCFLPKGTVHRIFALRLANGSSVPAKMLSRILPLLEPCAFWLVPAETEPNGLFVPADIVAGIVTLLCGTWVCCCCCSGCSGIEGCVLYRARILCLFIRPVGCAISG